MTRDSSQGYVQSECRDGIRTIEFFHPQSNSLPGKLLDALTQEVEKAGKDTDTRVILLRSGGDRAFCAGASFDELLAIETEQQGLLFFSGFANLINAMRKCPKFIVVRVQGKCVGGGVGLVAGADYAIATTAADIKLSELAIGIGPFVVGPVVEKRIGLAAFSALTIDATSWRTAQWGSNQGLFSELHPGTAEMDTTLGQLVGKLAQSNPEAMKLLKETFWKGTDHWDQLLAERAAISGRLVLSEFSRNAIAEFRKK